MNALFGNSCVGQSRQTVDNIGNSRFISEYYSIDALWLLELLGVLDESGLSSRYI